MIGGEERIRAKQYGLRAVETHQRNRLPHAQRSDETHKRDTFARSFHQQLPQLFVEQQQVIEVHIQRMFAEQQQASQSITSIQAKRLFSQAFATPSPCPSRPGLTTSTMSSLPVNKLPANPETVQELPKRLFDLGRRVRGARRRISGQDLNAVDSVAFLLKCECDCGFRIGS